MTETIDATQVHMNIENEGYDGGKFVVSYSNGYRVEVCSDDYPDDPRTWDNLGTMICWHRSYDLGDKQADSNYYESVEDMLKGLEEDYGDILVLPLFLFDHSGLRMSTNSSRFKAWDSQGWDWGMVGIIYVSHSDILDAYSADEITDDLLEKATECLVGEVAIYDQYVSGDVYVAIAYDADDDIIDSCGGFYGFDYALDEAKQMVEYHWNSFLSKTPVQEVLPFSE